MRRQRGWSASKRNGTDKLTTREIDAEVAAVRKVEIPSKVIGDSEG